MIRRIASYLLVVVIMVSVILVLSEHRGAREKGVRLSTEQDAQIAGTTDETSRGQVVQAVQNSFEANRHYFTRNAGQLGAEEIYYYYQVPGRGIAFLESAVLLKLQEAGSSRGHIIRLEFDGSKRVCPEGMEELTHRNNYFVGDRSNWCTNTPNCQEVWYRALYDGIDARFSFTPEGELKSEFWVRPGADPHAIRLRYEGAIEISVSASGRLRVAAGVSYLEEGKPKVFQGSDVVDGSFHLLEGGMVTYDIPSFDRSRPLIIDPSLEYSTYLGGKSREYGYGIAVDGDGFAYVTAIATKSGWIFLTPF